tara:strand:+ start:6170 stop:8962 length:2793 start_codon:yes stop_codon:yes gene_type:complete
MTSSFENFGNVIGTPRDQLPDIRDTNYLETEADMTEAVNKQIDEDIVNTKAFYDQAMRIEELRGKAFDKNLTALASITGSIGDIAKAVQADRVRKETEKINFGLNAKDIEELEKAEDKNKYLSDLFINQLNELKSEGLTFDENVDIEELVAEQLGQFEVDGNIRENLSQYQTQLKTLANNIFDQLNYDNLTDRGQAVGVNDFVKRVISNAIHANSLEAGLDISSGNYRRQFLKVINTDLKKTIDDRATAWEYNYRNNLNSQRKKALNLDIQNKFDTANSKDANDVPIKSNIFSGELVNRIAINQFPGDPQAKRKAFDFLVDEFASLAKTNDTEANKLAWILENVEYVDGSTGTTYANFNEYLNSIDSEKEPLRYALASRRHVILENAINEGRAGTVEIDKNQRTADLAAWKKEYFDPLNEEATRERRDITQAEKFRLITQFTESGLYNRNDPDRNKIPEYLQKFFADVGNLDPEVQRRLDYVKLINNQSDIIKQMILQRKVDRGLPDAGTFTEDDAFLARHLSDVLLAQYGESLTGPESQFGTEVSAGSDPLTFLSGKVAELQEKFLRGDYDGFARKLNISLAEKSFALKKAYKNDPSLIGSNVPHDGEEPFLSKGLTYIKTGGKVNAEVLEYFKQYSKQLGMTPRRIMLERLKATGAFKDDEEYGFYIDRDSPYMTEAEKLNMLTGGTHSVYNIATKDGGKNLKFVLDDLEHPDARKGTAGNKKTGYDWYDASNSTTNSYIGVPNGYISAQTLLGRKLTNVSFTSVLAAAELNPDIEIGRYGLTGKQLLEIANANNGIVRTLNSKAKFDANFQDYIAMEAMRYKLNRSNSARGFSINKKGKTVSSLTEFSLEEQQALDSVFPQLKDMSSAQLHNLAPQIANVILTDLEKAQKKGPEAVKEFKKKQKEERREKVKAETQKQIREGDVFTP